MKLRRSKPQSETGGRHRLQKVLAAAGVASRRAAEAMIRAGRVTVNGQVVTAMGTTVEVGRDRVAVDGRLVIPAVKKIYIALFKPRGVLSSTCDQRGRPVVADYADGAGGRLFPVGRLDYNTDGLLLMTNDGQLANGLLHPRRQVAKVYMVKVAGMVGEQDLVKLRQGIELDDGLTAPAGAEFEEYDEQRGWSVLSLTLYEGRNRQVRRMFANLGYEVMRLRRVAFAGITLDGLRRGQYRHLTAGEVKKLRELAGL
ncbi:MAG: rRNA pseudouridine synthase [Negativicutes bacterium]|nr:rRNA pseudouridine synthase [Negativicutes bacterium]